MYSTTRALSRNLPTKRTLKGIPKVREMSLFTPRTFITGDNYTNAQSSSFHPLFRLLDDFDTYSGRSDNASGNSNTSLAKTFNPKFDVREIETGYELHGELPGIEQKDVEIEFTDSQTLNIRGKVEREYASSGEKPGEETKRIESHQPTVEDEKEDGKAGQSSTAVEKSREGEKGVQKQAPKYWVSERSVGSFSRIFTFSQPIDHDNVKASMKNGLLHIVVPKKKAESRKVIIQ